MHDLFLYCQCDQLADVSTGERTLHNLCHHGVNPDNVRKHLASFILSHSAWICHVRNDYFTRRKIKPMHYLQELIREDFHYDLLAILIFAHMYHIHVKILSAKGCWVTNRRNLGCLHEIVLVYIGSMTFEDTRIIEWNITPEIGDGYVDEKVLVDTAFKIELDAKGYKVKSETGPIIEVIKTEHSVGASDEGLDQVTEHSVGISDEGLEQVPEHSVGASESQKEQAVVKKCVVEIEQLKLETLDLFQKRMCDIKLYPSSSHELKIHLAKNCSVVLTQLSSKEIRKYSCISDIKKNCINKNSL